MRLVKNRIEELFFFQNAHAAFEFFIVDNHKVVIFDIFKDSVPLLLGPIDDHSFEVTEELFYLSQPIISKTCRAYDQAGLPFTCLFAFVKDQHKGLQCLAEPHIIA
jgi:hypothetical protein